MLVQIKFKMRTRATGARNLSVRHEAPPGAFAVVSFRSLRLSFAPLQTFLKTTACKFKLEDSKLLNHDRNQNSNLETLQKKILPARLQSRDAAIEQTAIAGLCVRTGPFDHVGRRHLLIFLFIEFKLHSLESI